MNRQANRPRTFALCGVDGVGKTTLFRLLSESLDRTEFCFVERGPADAERLVEKRFPRCFGDWRDWVRGDHSEALAVACAFDYSLHFDRVIRNMVECYKAVPPGDCPKAIITDRHAICFLAYAYCNPSPNQLAVTLLKTVPAPDVIFFITAPEHIIQKRRKRDANRVIDEFEDVNAQRLLQAAYELLLPDYPSQIVTIDNSDRLEATCERIIAEIYRFLL